MKKAYTFVLISAAICLAGVAPEIASNGAPSSSTGAPNEGTCGTIGCHDDGLVNAGTASNTFIYNNGIAEYIPGETYTITVRIEDSGIERFGYQLLALNNTDNSNSGSFVITDPLRTQIIDNTVDPQLLDRRYATYLYAGTSAVVTGVGEWTIDWTAPVNDVGDVTFYYATLSADNDGTDSGDEFYTNSFVISPSAVLNIEGEHAQKFSVNIYPNPTTGIVNVELQKEGGSLIEIYNMQGSLIRSVDVSQKIAKINLKELSDGNYMIRISRGNEKIVKQITLKN
ncbi:MAG: T9SS type A sorting domain-containing protein [Flavobacteriales bacterium]|nr:T9SS type A sorting domain-containing protein [Flavobacteriales bacterium]